MKEDFASLGARSLLFKMVLILANKLIFVSMNRVPLGIASL